MFCLNSKSLENKSVSHSRYRKIYMKFRKLFNMSNKWKAKTKNPSQTKNLNNYYQCPRPMTNDNDSPALACRFVKQQSTIEEKSQETSCLFCRDSLQHVYQILFKTCNVKLNPIYFANRNVTDFTNDKQTCTQNKTKFQETCDLKKSHGWITNRIFLLVRSRNKIGCVSGISDIHPIRIYNDNSKQKERMNKGKTICSMQKLPDSNGIISLIVNGIIFKLHCKILTIDSIRNRLNDSYPRHSIISNPGPQNHATVTAKYKNDLIQFKFDLFNVTIQPITFKVSRGSQVVDGHRYIPYYNHMTARKVFIPVPRAHMDYCDPMLKLRAIARNEQFDPVWLRTVRKQRLAKWNCSSIITKKVKDSKTPNTMITAENGGIVYKIKAGMLKIDDIKNLSKYESFVITRQRAYLKKKWEKIRNEVIHAMYFRDGLL